MLERLPCRPGCATLTTDRETDRQVGQGFVLQSSCLSLSRERTTPDGDRYIFHQLLRLHKTYSKPGGVRDPTVALAAPIFTANINKDPGSKSRRGKCRAPQYELFVKFPSGCIKISASRGLSLHTESIENTQTLATSDHW